VNKQWTVAAGLDPQDSPCPRLEVRFVWRQDRFQHDVVLVTETGETRLLQSCEGDDQQEFPPSPPLQDMSVEVRPGAQVALAVGMAGSALWSVSVQATQGAGRIEFDWACQTRGAQLWPQNCYLLPVLPDTDNAAAGRTGFETGAAKPNGTLSGDSATICHRSGHAPDDSMGRTLHQWQSPQHGQRQVVLQATGPQDLLLFRYEPDSKEALQVTNTVGAVNDVPSAAVLLIRQAQPDQVPQPATGPGGLRWQYQLLIR